MRIDLNSDLGEAYGAWSMGDDSAMLDVVSSANIACGAHAGDPEVMFTTLQTAAANGVAIGAHPGYADREGFGRRVIPMSPAQAARMMVAQIGALQALAALAGARVCYVKPHGALANLAAAEPELARTLARAVRDLDPSLAVLAISGTALDQAARAEGIETYSEIFADRAYLPDGQLMPRARSEAVLHDADAVVKRLIDWLDDGTMPAGDGGRVRLAGQSICVHGDTPGAVDMARHIRSRLTDAGVTIAPFLSS
ncbi:LamB/YcsF family protein [Paracoccus sp. TK19116]|uniref:5-oxoprolinase subunit A n=1 Tax=Paracoccus albicereus TaxID=2922394 RepID=A0ABT1MMW5_9RHOB|nr:5-oxoprolinase subunit PxpA [Paracoccus albicereus]MCQ0969625.1 LamB/YcsF family protein [Paracoccus albicereus]